MFFFWTRIHTKKNNHNHNNGEIVFDKKKGRKGNVYYYKLRLADARRRRQHAWQSNISPNG